MKELQEIEIHYGGSSISNKRIQGSKDVYDLCIEIFGFNSAQFKLKEYFYILLLDRANHVLGFHKLSEGGISGTVADLRIAFGMALKCIATSMILCHNHPSGNVKPSRQDEVLTKRFIDAGKLLDIHVLDHLIISTNSYYSFADECTL